MSASDQALLTASTRTGAGPGKLGWSLHRELHPSYDHLAGRNKTTPQKKAEALC